MTFVPDDLFNMIWPVIWLDTLESRDNTLVLDIPNSMINQSKQFESLQRNIVASRSNFFFLGGGGSLSKSNLGEGGIKF